MRMLTKALSAMAFFGGMAVLRADTAPAQPAVKLTNADVAVKAAGLQTQIQEDNRHLMLLKARAVKLKDVIKVTCVNDKLVQAKAQMNIADTANDNLTAAMAKNNDDERNTEFTSLGQAADAMKHLTEEAAACIGTPELMKQEAGITVDRPVIIDDPTATDPFGGESGYGQSMEPPAYPSPFM